jgi:hypothetical protein
MQLLAATVSGALIATQSLASSPTRLRLNRPRQTFLAGTEVLDLQYTPAMRLPGRYRDYFLPTVITDPDGGLNEAVAEDLLSA